mmetsp:Transcript_86994/g.226012  ORF Transcript_86994/g.226012 Transcript_86994/m.226012 type:complete len:221 (+) Transcript_86994:736-1398(+)
MAPSSELGAASSPARVRREVRGGCVGGGVHDPGKADPIVALATGHPLDCAIREDSHACCRLVVVDAEGKVLPRLTIHSKPRNDSPLSVFDQARHEGDAVPHVAARATVDTAEGLPAALGKHTDARWSLVHLLCKSASSSRQIPDGNSPAPALPPHHAQTASTMYRFPSPAAPTPSAPAPALTASPWRNAAPAPVWVRTATAARNRGAPTARRQQTVGFED